MLNWRTTSILVLMLCASSLSAQTIYKRSCPSGTVPIVGPTTVTVDNTTGQYIQQWCIDNLGNLIATGFSAQSINNVVFADQQAGANIGAQLNACISAVVAAGGGICDARGLASGTISSQVDVGSNANPNAGVTLLLPKAATWSVSITDGVSCGIMLHDKSTIIGANGQGNGNLMVIAAASSATNVKALFCTDPSPVGGGQYVRAEGFLVRNTVGATMGLGAFVAQQLFDNSVFRDISSINSSGVGILVANACCGTSFYNILTDGNNGAGAKPLVLGSSTVGGNIGGGLVSVGFYGLSATHAGASQNEINITNISNTENVNFYNVYIEPNATDTSTAAVQLNANNRLINFYGLDFSATAGGSTAYAIDLATWAGPCNCVFEGIKSQTSNAINDHVTGVTVNGAASFGQAPSYISGSLTIGGTISPGSVTFANLGTPSNGVLVYCSDCTIANPCAGAGTGAIAKRLNGVWVCN